MTVRRLFVTVLALLACLLGAGCGGSGTRALGPETEDPTYIEGKKLKRQNRYSEALNAFLKVIETRGMRESPESHLEAGQLYLEHMKNPLIAAYYFQQYQTLQPNSAEAPRVRNLYGQALREFATTIPGRILEDQSVRMEMTDEVRRLQRELDEVRAENATLRGGGATPVNRAGTLPLVNPRPRTNPLTGNESISSSAPPSRPTVDEPLLLQPAPPLNSPATPARNPTPQRPATPAGRTYTVKQSDGLFGIARQFDARNTSAKLQQIIEANPDVLPDGLKTPLKPGMILRIP